MTTHTITAAAGTSTVRGAAIATALGAALWTIPLLLPGAGTATPSVGLVGLAFSSVLLAAAPVAVYATAVAGRGLLARAGLALSLAARVVFLVGMVGVLAEPATEATQSATPIAALLTTLGMGLLGVATLRAHVWHGWRAWSVLGVAVFFVVQAPVQAIAFIGATGDPSYAVLALWGLPWLALAWALATAGGVIDMRGRNAAHEPAPRTESR